MSITKAAVAHINEDLLDKLMVALTPISIGKTTDQWHVGYFNAQADFRLILQHHLNKGELPDVKSVKVDELQVTAPKPNRLRFRWPL